MSFEKLKKINDDIINDVLVIAGEKKAVGKNAIVGKTKSGQHTNERMGWAQLNNYVEKNNISVEETWNLVKEYLDLLFKIRTIRKQNATNGFYNWYSQTITAGKYLEFLSNEFKKSSAMYVPKFGNGNAAWHIMQKACERDNKNLANFINSIEQKTTKNAKCKTMIKKKPKENKFFTFEEPPLA